jgi:Winged helix DNA-binding domain
VPGPERLLTRPELNRALLKRQLLLDRSALRTTRAVGHLGGLQAQSTPSPYLSLWTRLEAFERDELTKALTGRRLVKALLQRGTLHVVTPKHYWAIAMVRRQLAPMAWPASYEALVPLARIAELGSVVLEELDGRELTLKDVQALLEPHAHERVPPTFLWRRIQAHAFVIHVPP